MGDRDIDRALRDLVGRPGGTLEIRVGEGILGGAARWIDEAHAGQADLVVCDADTAAAAGRRFASALGALGRQVALFVVEPTGPGGEVVCDDASVALVEGRLAAQPALNAVAVGAGSINDIVKMATAHRAQPYQCVATAASMNGYTSAIAAVLSKGVKRTLPAPQAEAVFADIEVIAAAPARLNRAGFGDLLSKPFSQADWLLSHLVRGVPYQEHPARLLDGAYRALLGRAGAVGAGEREGLGTLTRTLLLSGFSMALAGTSSPASGGEHLVSHYWDMEQHCRHQPLHALHGAQVGIATRLSAMLYERLISLDASDIDPRAALARRPDASWLDDIAPLHPRLTPPVVAQVRAQILAKQRHGAELVSELQGVAARWDEIRAALSEVLLPSAVIDEALACAGAADRPSGIGVTREHALHTLRVCRQMRGRYVALDLMDDLGRLGGWAASALDACEGDRARLS